jgi:hypothetical protein
MCHGIKSYLLLFRKRAAQTVWIHNLSIEPLWFQPDAVSLEHRESQDFALDRWAVARAVDVLFDVACQVDVLRNDLVCLLTRKRLVAHHLAVCIGNSVIHRREWHRAVIAGLGCTFAVVNGAGVQPCRRSGAEPPQLESKSLHRL